MCANFGFGALVRHGRLAQAALLARRFGRGTIGEIATATAPKEDWMRVHRAANFARAGIIFFGMAGMAVAAAADPVEDFYKGKQIRVVIRASPGGNYDLYSRLLIRHMLRFIPGHPTGLPVNMPGGSGLTALSYAAEVHPKDGTVLTMITQSFPLEQALNLNDKLIIGILRHTWNCNTND